MQKVLLRCCVYAVLAFSGAAPNWGADADAMDAMVARYHSFGNFNGAVLVAENGEVVFKKAYGLANREWGAPNTTDTRFRIGSITKQFTASVVLQLVDEGKIELEAPISTYLPDYPPDIADKVTVHQLLTHTSGIKSYTGMKDFRREVSRDPYKPDDFISYFADEPLDFAPGKRFKYNNSGYFLLGVIIEKVTGQSYAEALNERVFGPLAMNDSGYDTHGEIVPKRATGYDYLLDGYRNSAYLDMSLPYAAGSLYSTVEDLYKWDRALAAGQVLPAAMMQEMFAEHVISRKGERPTYYAYGWTVGEAKRPGVADETVRLVQHGGGINGFNTLIQRIPEDDHLVVLLNNTPGANLGQMASKLVALLYGEAPALPKTPLSTALVSAYREGGVPAAVLRYEEIEAEGVKGYDASDREWMRLTNYFMRAGKLGEAGPLLDLAEKAKAAGK